MIKGLTIEGSKEGLEYLLTPKIYKLGDINVWRMGLAQILFSTSCGMGGNIAMSALREKKNEVVKSVGFIVGSNSIASLMGSISLFSFVG